MNSAASLGRALATPQYWLTTIIAGVLVIFGIYSLYNTLIKKAHGSKSVLFGGGFVAAGVIIGVLARRWYYLVMNNDYYARAAGMLDIARFIKFNF